MADGSSGKRKMSDDEILNLVALHENASLGSPVAAGATVGTTIFNSGQQMTTLEIDRWNALNAYWARPLGNELENRSQIVLPELRDTVEWIMPQLMRMFVGSKQICRFDPEGQQDIEQAQAESDAVNHIFIKENNGFFVLYDYFKDALLLRNGYARVDWIEEKYSNLERYSGLTEDELAQVMQPKEKDEEIEVIEQREYPLPLPLGLMSAAGASPQNPTQQQIPGAVQPQSPTMFDVKIRRTGKRGRVKVDCIPSEEMRISPRTRGINLDDSPFVEEISRVSRSELIEDGYSRDVVDKLPEGRPAWLDLDELARNELVDQLSIEDPAQHAMQQVERRQVVMPLDYDDDGIAELRRLMIAGDKVLENEEVEEQIYTSSAPNRMPHRHTGISLYDEIVDLQIIKTQLFRGGLDNLALANNSRTAVDWQNCNIDDLLTSRPGGVVRGKGPPGQWIQALESPTNIIEQVFPAMEYCDKLREMRTGVGRTTMGLDADELQDVTKGNYLAAQSMATLKIEMVARLLAEGVKDIFTKMHNTILRHQDKPFEFEVSGKWIKADPTTWRRRSKVSVNVGLGSGSRQEARQNLALLGQMQDKVGQAGLVGPMQLYETFKRGCDLLGFENPQAFAMDPKSPEYAQHQQQMQQAAKSAPPDPRVQTAKIQADSRVQVAQAQSQNALVKTKGELAHAQLELAAEKEKHDRELAHDVIQGHMDRQTEVMGLESQAGIALLKIIGQIVAAQLKQNAQADAGQVLKHDYAEVRGLV